MRLEERSRDGICTNFEESLTSAHKEEAHARHKEVHGELKEEATHNIHEIGNHVQRFESPLLQNEGGQKAAKKVATAKDAHE